MFEDRVSFLLKGATKAANEKHFETALTLHSEAIELSGGQNNVLISVLLRKANYLHAAGRVDEAWAYTNLLLSSYKSFPETLPMDHSEIYQKQANLLLKEGKCTQAIRHAVLSYASWSRGLLIQERYAELTDISVREGLLSRVRRPLSAAKLKHLESKLYERVRIFVRDRNERLSSLARDVNLIVKTE